MAQGLQEDGSLGQNGEVTEYGMPAQREKEISRRLTEQRRKGVPMLTAGEGGHVLRLLALRRRTSGFYRS